jgi:putative transcription factor
MFDCRQDWAPVVISKRPPSAKGKAKEVVDDQGNAVPVEAQKRFAAGTNKNQNAPCYARKLAEETEELKHKTITMEVRLVIQQARTAKGLKQEDLARLINEPQKVIAEYESGKAIPNQQIFNKLEKALQVKLRGKDIGGPLVTQTPKPKPAPKSVTTPKPGAKRAGPSSSANHG